MRLATLPACPDRYSCAPLYGAYGPRAASAIGQPIPTLLHLGSELLLSHQVRAFSDYRAQSERVGRLPAHKSHRRSGQGRSITLGHSPWLAAFNRSTLYVENPQISSEHQLGFPQYVYQQIWQDCLPQWSPHQRSSSRSILPRSRPHVLFRHPAR